MEARRRSVSKNDAKAPYNRKSESHVAEHAPHMLPGSTTSYDANQSRYLASQ